MNAKLDKNELNRYDRQLRLPELGIQGQGLLKQSSVLVIGAGGLGCPVLTYLAASGVGKIGVIDSDRVILSNLQRQVLFSEDDIDKNKAQAAVASLEKLNSAVIYESICQRFSADNASEIVAGYDLIIDCSDNFETRYLVNDVCVINSKPFIFGAIFKFEGQVAVFNYADVSGKRGPTYRCLFPEIPDPKLAPSCDEIGVLGVLPGIVGTLMATEAIKCLAKIGEPLSGYLLSINALTAEFKKTKINRTAEAEEKKSIRKESFMCSKDAAITAKELVEKITQGEVIQIIDVREKSEYEIAHIGGELMPLKELDGHVAKIARDRLVVVHCHHGVRSQRAIDYLSERHGFTNLVNLSGGIDAWSIAVDPKVARY